MRKGFPTALVAYAALSLCCASLLAAQRVDTVVVIHQLGDRKDPGTATLLSFLIPGAGQMYAGEAGKGGALFVLAYGAPITGALLSTYETDAKGVTRWNFGPLYAGTIVGLGAWIVGWGSAASDARTHNGRLQQPVSVIPILQRDGEGTRVGLGVSVMR